MMYYINWGVIKILKETINIFEHNKKIILMMQNIYIILKPLSNYATE